MPLRDDAGALLEALVTATIALRNAYRLLTTLSDADLPDADPPDAAIGDRTLPNAPLDAIARRLPFAEPLAEPLRAAADALVGHAMQAADSADLRARRDALHEGLERVRDALPIALPAVPRSHRRAARAAALGHVAALLREAGLESADADVHLASEQGGGEVLVSVPVPVATAKVWLLDAFYQRTELAVLDHELLALERLASQWHFRRWGGDATRRAADDAFGRAVREQEYSFVERATLAFGVPVVAALADYASFATWPPRQRWLAPALTRSVASVFTVRAREGSTTELADAGTHRVYRVHEHNEEIAYAPGFIALGRLIPLDGERWLRSPGMAFATAPNGEVAPALARAVTESPDTLGPALTIEAAIATMTARTRAALPLTVKPARSAAEARALAWELNEVLREAGLAKRVAKKRAPAELRALAATTPGTQIFEFSVDAVVAEWMQALVAQGGAGPPGTPRVGRARARRRWGE